MKYNSLFIINRVCINFPKSTSQLSEYSRRAGNLTEFPIIYKIIYFPKSRFTSENMKVLWCLAGLLVWSSRTRRRFEHVSRSSSSLLTVINGGTLPSYIYLSSKDFRLTLISNDSGLVYHPRGDLLITKRKVNNIFLRKLDFKQIFSLVKSAG